MTQFSLSLYRAPQNNFSKGNVFLFSLLKCVLRSLFVEASDLLLVYHDGRHEVYHAFF